MLTHNNHVVATYFPAGSTHRYRAPDKNAVLAASRTNTSQKAKTVFLL